MAISNLMSFMIQLHDEANHYKRQELLIEFLKQHNITPQIQNINLAPSVRPFRPRKPVKKDKTKDQIFLTPQEEQAFNDLLYTFEVDKTIYENQINSKRNIYVGNIDTAKIILSAHLDGNEYHDNIGSDIIMLDVLLNNPSLQEKVLFVWTDLEERGGKGMREFCKLVKDKHLPAIILEVAASGHLFHVGTTSAGETSPLLISIIEYLDELNIDYFISATPFSDQYIYNRKCNINTVLLSLVNLIDMIHLDSFYNQKWFKTTFPQKYKYLIQKYKKHPNAREAVLNRMHTVVNDKKEDINPEEMQRLSDFLSRFLQSY